MEAQVLCYEETGFSETEFMRLCHIVRSSFGISLDNSRKGLLEMRLNEMLRHKDFAALTDYLDYIEHFPNPSSLAELANCVLVNHTYFYREKDHFDFMMREALPEQLKRLELNGENELRILCAGCSSGEEAYTIAMLLSEELEQELCGCKITLIATDASEKMINIAETGIYDESRFTELPAWLKYKYFHRQPDSSWEICSQLKDLVHFKVMNLMDCFYPFARKFHMIFCRNVMIYFDELTRSQVLNKFASVSEKNSYIFISHSELLPDTVSNYEYVRSSIYRHR